MTHARRRAGRDADGGGVAAQSSFCPAPWPAPCTCTQGTPEFDGYAVFDPKAPPGRATLERAKGPFREAMVFMIGGGTYYEREALLAWAQRSSQASMAAGQGARQVVYGATELLTGEEFVQQLNELGRRSGVVR